MRVVIELNNLIFKKYFTSKKLALILPFQLQLHLNGAVPFWGTWRAIGCKTCKFELAVSVVFMSWLPVLFLFSMQTIQQLINNERADVWLGLEIA